MGWWAWRRREKQALAIDACGSADVSAGVMPEGFFALKTNFGHWDLRRKT